MNEREELLARLEASQKACFNAGQHVAAMDIQSARAELSRPATVAQGQRDCGEDIQWRQVNAEPFEYAIQQGPHGDEFVKLLSGTCLRRSIYALPSTSIGSAA